MARPPVLPAGEKTRIVLSILAGDHRRGGGAAGEGVGAVGRELEAPVPRSRPGWAGRWEVRPSTREQQLQAEVSDLTQALGEAAVELRVWKKSAEGRLGPSRTSR